jgi:iron complex outermembrane receptor protein
MISPAFSHDPSPRRGVCRRLHVLAMVCAAVLTAAGAWGSEVRNFDIPRTTAAAALPLFLEQSGADVAFANADLQRVQTNPLRGAYSAKVALERMLANTSLAVLHDVKTGALLIRRAEEPPSGAPNGNTHSASPMNTKSKTTLGLLLSSLTLGVTAVDAQNTSPRDVVPSDEVVSLNEFRVSTSTVNEYLAADSITGTRVASKLSELPFAVNVVTSEFLNDFVLLELNEQLATVSGFSPNENENSYQLRGFASGTTLVDGFRWLGSASASFGSNIDRIEVIKGAVGSIYGQINPGGVINTITRKPLTRREQGLSVLAGSLDSFRSTAYATGPAGRSGKLFYRADVSYYQRRYDEAFADLSQYYGSLQFAYRHSTDTSVNVAFSLIDTRKHVVSSIPINSVVIQDPYRPVGRTFTFYTGLNTNLLGFSLHGPSAYQDALTQSARASLEHRFNPVWSLRAGVSAVEATREVNRQGGNTLAVATQSLTLRPLWQLRKQDAVAAQVDTLASFRTGPVAHKLLFTLDYNHEQRSDDGFQMSNASRALNARQFTLLPANPLYGFALYRDNRAAYDELADDDEVGYSVFGVFVSERAALLDNRLILMAGGRYDQVSTDPKTLGVQGASYSVSDFTYQAGATFRVTKGLSLYANQSTSFSPQPNLDLSGNPLPNEQGSGYEFGLKLLLAGDRLSLSLNRFQVDRENIAVLLIDPVTLREDYVLSTHERSNGYELDINWQVTDAFQLLGGYGFTEARAINNPSATYLIGRNVLKRVPENNLGAAARYKFTGPLKGLTANASVRWLSESIINIGGRSITPTTANPFRNTRFDNGLLPYPNRPVDSLVTSGAPVRVGDGRESVYNGAATTWDFGIGYSFATSSKRFRHQLRLNVKNAFDVRYSYGAGIAGDPRMILGEYAVKF